MSDAESDPLPTTNGTTGTEERTGLDALYESAMTPDMVETQLQFQWMRLHPATAIALSEDQSSPAVRASRMMPHYRAAAIRRANLADNGDDDTKDNKTPENTGANVESPFFKTSGIEIDLCDLFDPPLMSETVPGGGTHHPMDRPEPEKQLDDSTSSLKRPRPIQVSDKVHNEESNAVTEERISLILDTVVDAAATETLRKEGNATYAALLKDHLAPLSRLSQEELMEKLSSLLVCEKALERSRRLEEAQEEGTSGASSELSVLVLVLLAEYVASEPMGYHIVTVLAPVLLTKCDLSSSQRVGHYLHRLALALVSNCSMWKLSKTELQELTSSDPGVIPSAAMQELVCCIGESYYMVREQHSLST